MKKSWEEWAVEKKTAADLVAAARVWFRWVVGKKLTEVEYLDAINHVSNLNFG